MSIKQHPASFRDPAGNIFYADNKLLRTINNNFRDDFDAFLTSGLYENLRDAGCITSFQDVPLTSVDAFTLEPSVYKIVQPEYIHFISYPYEWSFSQLRGAALLTLFLQKNALQYDMVLKDATALNIQFHNGRPIHIDSLSFIRYQAGSPWVAYRQFCQHFLLPLVLMAYRDVTLVRLLSSFPDGIPLDIGVKLLGWHWWRKPSLLMHLVLHAKLETYSSGKVTHTDHKYSIRKESLIAMANSLERLIQSLPTPDKSSHWTNYSDELPYTKEEYVAKKDLVARYCRDLSPKTVWDVGANSGAFSQIAMASGARVIALESDHAQVEALYALPTQADQKILPLWVDMLCPSSMGGWGHQEHQSLAARGPADLLLCLALTHHLAITGNVPFGQQAEYFSSIANYVVIEYIDVEDSNVKRMLPSKPALKDKYTRPIFEAEFSKYFIMLECQTIVAGKRFIYLFKRI